MLFPRKYPKIHKHLIDKRSRAVYHVSKEEKTPEMPSYLNVVQMDVTRFTPIYTRAVSASAKFLGLWVTHGITSYGTFADVLRMMGLTAREPA